MSKSHPQQWIINEEVERPDPALVAALREFATTQIAKGDVLVVDGLDGIGLPTFACTVHPATGSNQGPGAINVPVQCGGVAVRPGDVIRGDASGLVVIPREHVEQVIELSKEVAEREISWRSAIAGGATLPAATDIDDLLADLRPPA